MFGEILRRLREEKGLSQKDLADYLKISRQAYNHYESGKREPSYETLKSLSNYFEVSTDYLLGRTDIRNSADRISEALEDDEELSIFWDDMKERPELKILFKQTRELSPKAIQQVIRIIKAIEDEEDRENN
ncbi:helix-turn-helix transcriptional regulator [Tissierella sp.]|uniref:helix-turn-helix domain-containing protein n=1 Tax=Tissierella sp. TaxID=41274 RepID=UPI00303E7676